MPTTRRPRRGSMGYFPRKRAKRIYPNTSHYPFIKDTKPLGFAGHKIGMTHALKIETNPGSKVKGQLISVPITLLECPPISVFGYRFYKLTSSGFSSITQVLAENLDKSLLKRIQLSKKSKEKKQIQDYNYIALLCHTNPSFKKTPEIFEIQIGGEKEKQLEYAKSILGKQIKLSDVFKPSDFIDVSAVTKGKGFQGPVKRFGIKIQGRKNEQAHRHVGALGPQEPGRILSYVPQGGQMGFHTRTELNKKLLKISALEEVIQAGGFLRYGNPKGEIALIEGSVPGPSKRLIRFRFPIRPRKSSYPVDLRGISTSSKQGA